MCFGFGGHTFSFLINLVHVEGHQGLCHLIRLPQSFQQQNNILNFDLGLLLAGRLSEVLDKLIL